MWKNIVHEKDCKGECTFDICERGPAYMLISQRGGTESGHLCVHAYVSSVSVCMGDTEGRDEGETLENLSNCSMIWARTGIHCPFQYKT